MAAWVAKSDAAQQASEKASGEVIAASKKLKKVGELQEEIHNHYENCGKVRLMLQDFIRFGRNSIKVGYFMEMVFPVYGIRFISINDEI